MLARYHAILAISCYDIGGYQMIHVRYQSDTCKVPRVTYDIVF